MEKRISIKKGIETSRLSILAEILKDFNKLDLIDNAEKTENQKLFGGNTTIAVKSFEVSCIITELCMQE